MTTKVEQSQTRNRDTLLSSWIGAVADALLFVPRLIASFFRNGM